jgi:transketolase
MPSNSSVERLSIDTIRALAMDAVQKANSGHPGAPMALAPLGYLLWTRFRRHNPADPAWPGRDRFVLSNGHASMLQYALLYLTGYDLTLEDLKQFRQWGSRTPGHPENALTPGVEVTTGPLGQGFANGVGMAMAADHLARRFDREGHRLFDHHVYAICSDGDLMEGASHEAASLAGHLRLGRLIYFYDDNHITIEGPTTLAFSEDVDKRFQAYGWHTRAVEDAEDLEALAAAIEAARTDPRPSLIRVRTHIAHPAPNLHDSAEAHGAPLGEAEVRATKEVMGWPPDETFRVPEEVLAHCRAVRERGAALQAEWEERRRRYEISFPEDAVELRRCLAGELPAGWEKDLPRFEPSPKGTATRAAAGKVLGALMERIPNLVGGSADLAPSTKTLHPRLGTFGDAEGVPRNVHFGVREHAMGGICTGMAVHGGVIPFGATFLIFSDYMRPAIRLAALSERRVIYVFTHDSVGLGEDGPTHQPVEHLASLRAIPNLTVIRPADANEARHAWIAALRREGPVALVLTRQEVPTLDRTGLGSAEGVERGAYVLADANLGEPEVILIASGSEVAVALEARSRLEASGTGARVVSMASWELFEEQPKSYREKVLPPHVRARVSVEAASPLGWERWVGDAGEIVGIDIFGASAPAAVNMEKFGFTAADVERRARLTLSRSRAVARAAG